MSETLHPTKEALDRPTSVPGVEECPGFLEWSAFGASYQDTVCSSALDWTECDIAPAATLCDADDGFRPKDVPCPFCDVAGFTAYQFGTAGEFVVLWESDQTVAPRDVEIHFHDARALWWSATHPERGEECVLISRVVDLDES